MSDADRPAFEIRREEAATDGPAAALVVVGDLDLAVADRLEAALDPGQWTEASALVLDLSGVGFIDSSGIKVVARRLQELDQAGIGAGAVVAPEGAVARAIELSGLTDLLPLEPDRESAERRVAR